MRTRARLSAALLGCGLMLAAAPPALAQTQPAAAQTPPGASLVLPDGWRSLAGPPLQPIGSARPRLPVDVDSDDRAKVKVTDISRVVAGGDDVIEIMEVLGLGDRVHAAPERSTTAAGRAARHQFLFNRTTGAEGILSLDGTLFLGNSLRRHGKLAAVLRSTGLPSVVVDDVQPAPARIRKVASALGLAAEGEALAARVQQQLDEATAIGKTLKRKPRVLHVSASGGGGRPTVGGRDTAAAQLIRLAGGDNLGDAAAAADYTALSQEGVVAADPEVVLLSRMDLELFGGPAALWKAYPSLRQTAAGVAQRIWVMPDDQLKVAGTQAGAGALALAAAFRELINP